MVDVRAKGAKFELEIRDKLRTLTGYSWERAPASGALSAKLGMKGDIILPAISGALSLYAIECKSYAEDAISSNLLYKAKQTFDDWWAQTTREACQMKAKPMLVFKKDRGKHMLAIDEEIPGLSYLHINKGTTNCYVYLFDEAITKLNLYKEIK